MKNRYTGPDRIIGVDKTTEEYLKIEKLGQILEKQDLISFEREKSPEEIIIISEILRKLPDFLIEYGAEDVKTIFLKQIHILDKTKAEPIDFESFFESGIAGRYIPFQGSIEIAPTNNLEMAHILVHELLHANSFFSINIKPDEEKINIRRFGIATKQNDNDYELFFNFINEALTEELTKRFCEKSFADIDIIKENFIKLEESKATNKALPEISPLSAKASILPEFSNEGENLKYGYVNERIGFLNLLDELYEKNSDKFTSYNDIFKLFSSAMFNGNLLPIASLIEKTLGKGAFRTIGEQTRVRPET